MRALFAVAVVAMALGMNIRPSEASGKAPWCAVISLGMGDGYWDCQYRSVAECAPVVTSGNRGFCSPNPAADEPVSPPPRRKHRG